MKLLDLSEYQGMSGGKPSRRTLARWCAEGRVPGAKRMGGKWYVEVGARHVVPDAIADDWEAYRASGA